MFLDDDKPITASPEQTRVASELLRAMAHPARLTILRLLSEGEEMTVRQLEEAMGMPQAIVSQQLVRLKEDGLVVCRRDERDGRFVCYAIARSGTADFLRALFSMAEEPVLYPPLPGSPPIRRLDDITVAIMGFRHHLDQVKQRWVGH